MEYKESEISQWFDLSVQKPWQEGVYEVQEACDIKYGTVWHSYWNGNAFCFYTCAGAEDAYRSREQDTGCRTFRWRGLSSDPSHKPKRKGNPRVTRYVVLSQNIFLDMSSKVDSEFSSAPLAEARANYLRAKVDDHVNVWVQKIRFRTPEAKK